MWNRKAWLLCGLLLARMPGAAAQAPNPDSILLSQAQEEFSQRRYSDALNSFRAYLRNHPDDQDTWTRFAATYYHTGQAKQALIYLRKARPPAALRNYNQFYQALCYDALGDRNQANRILNRLIKTDDSFAEDALFEKAANRFEDGDAAEAKAAAEDYLKRFRDGRYKAAVEQILRQLPLAGKMEVPESQRARYRKSYFEQHPLSILPYPHLWYYRLGYSYVRGTRSNPGYDKGEPTIETGIGYEQFKLLTSAGLTIGPFTGNGAQSYIGYNYSQDWLSDGDRMTTYFNDPTDLQYFPFRPDLMERTHRLFAESSSRRGDFSFGAYAHWEFKRSGSELFPAPERPEIRKAFDVSTGTLFVPWVEWNYLGDHRLRSFFLMEKLLNREQSDFSFKTYNLSTGSEDPFLSLSLQHSSDWQSLNLKTTFELFRWRYLSNDFWESYVSTGLAAAGELQLFPQIKLSARAAFMDNSYDYATIKTGPCSSSKTSQTSDVGVSASLCERSDQKFRVGASLIYLTNKQQALSAVLDYRDLTNATQKVYNETALDLLFVYTHSFPSLSGASRFIEPYRGLTGTQGVL